MNPSPVKGKDSFFEDKRMNQLLIWQGNVLIMQIKIKCFCCGFFTIEGEFDICPVCYWQKDSFQESVDYSRGPNLVSLIDARINYKIFGAVEVQFKKYVRLPFDEEK